MNKTKKAKRVIPGFGLSMGVTVSILSIIVLIPLASLVIYTAQMSWSDFIDTVTSERVMASYKPYYRIHSLCNKCGYGCYTCMGAGSL